MLRGGAGGGGFLGNFQDWPNLQQSNSSFRSVASKAAAEDGKGNGGNEVMGLEHNPLMGGEGKFLKADQKWVMVIGKWNRQPVFLR